MNKRLIFFSCAALFILLSCLPVYSQKKGKGSSFPYSWGVGVKLGDPSGFSLKKYNGDKGLELILGRGYYWGNYHYDYYFYHDNRFKDKPYDFLGYYDRTVPLVIQLHYLIHKPLSDFQGFRWYFGGGGQFRTSSYYYKYYDRYSGNVLYDKVNDIGIGLDGVVGLEYTFDDVPITLGLDVNVYVELFDRPFFLLGQGGLAARFNF